MLVIISDKIFKKQQSLENYFYFYYLPSKIFAKFLAATLITLTVFIKVSIRVPAHTITKRPALLTTI